MSRLKLVLLGVPLGLLVALPMVAMTLHDPGRPAAAIVSSPTDKGYRGNIVPDGIKLPTFALHDADGRLVQSSDLAGRALAVTFVDTTCQDACPVIGELLSRGIDLLAPAERARAHALAITVDPARDTRRRARAWLKQHRADGRITYLLGTEGQLQPVWRSFNVFPATDSGDPDSHSALVAIYTPRGTMVSALGVGQNLSPANVAHDLRRAAASAD